MKDESRSKITSEYHSVYVDKCSQKFHSHSRPLGTEIAPLLSTRGEKGGLLLPCDEPNLNAAWPKFAAQPQQPFSLNDEFGGVHGPSASDADRNPAFPNHRAATRLMLAGGGWPGAAGSGAATGSAEERSLPPLPSWLAAAAAASAGSTDYLQGPALPARPLAWPPAPAIGPGWLRSAAAPAPPAACLPGTGVLPGFWLPPPPPPPR